MPAMSALDARIRMAPPSSTPDARPVEELAADLIGRPLPVLRAAAGILNDERSRSQLLAAVTNDLWDGEHVRVEARDGELSGLTLDIAREHGGPVLDVAFAEHADLRALYHPLAAALPVVGDDHCMVATRPCANATFAYLDRDLVGPRLAGRPRRRASLLAYLARLIDPAPADDDPIGRRYVEPGVGRTYLVDFLRLLGQPELRDFSVTGAGLTPFSTGGYFFRGPHIDGHMPMIRATHRLRLGNVLQEAGCRVPAVAAIIASPELEHTMPDHSRLPAALLVRGFRTILRVKQLDPLANVLMSTGAWTYVQQLLRAGHWCTDLRLRGAIAPEPDRPVARRESCTCLVPSFFVGARPGRRCEEDTACRHQRIALLREHAPGPLRIARARLSEELGRDPDRELVTNAEYVRWFAATMGAQLAAMRSVRFLHDYRVAQTEWADPFDLLNSLTDTNITLLAELADLDTGVLVDRGEFCWLEALRISLDAWQALREDYDALHENEVRIARGLVATVAFAAGERPSDAAANFLAAYERAAERRSVALQRGPTERALR
jgi:hypothetical protein